MAEGMAHKAHLIWVVAVAALVVDVLFAVAAKFNITIPVFSSK